MATWRIRVTMDDIDIGHRYAGHPTIFSIQLHHGGEFTQFPERKYINGNRHYVDLLDIDTFSIHDIDEMMTELGYIGEDVTKLYYHFQRPFSDLDFGLFALGSDQDVLYLATFVGKHKLIDIYTEHGKTNLHTYLMSPNQGNVRIAEIEQPSTCSKRLLLNWHEPPIGGLNNDPNVTVQGTVTSPTEQYDSHFDKDPLVVQHDNLLDKSRSGDELDDNSTDSDDSDFIMDEDNLLNDLDVDMKDFHLNIDKDVEWVGGASNTNILEVTEEEEEDIEVINTEVLLSGSSSDEGMDGK